PIPANNHVLRIPSVVRGVGGIKHVVRGHMVLAARVGLWADDQYNFFRDKGRVRRVFNVLLKILVEPIPLKTILPTSAGASWRCRRCTWCIQSGTIIDTLPIYGHSDAGNIPENRGSKTSVFS